MNKRKAKKDACFVASRLIHELLKGEWRPKGELNTALVKLQAELARRGGNTGLALVIKEKEKS